MLFEQKCNLDKPNEGSVFISDLFEIRNNFDITDVRVLQMYYVAGTANVQYTSA